MVTTMAQSKEYRECRRVGYRGYVPSGDRGCICSCDDHQANAAARE